jgi:hypothetical protein
MEFKLNNSKQYACSVANVKFGMYSYLNDVSKNNRWVHISGPVVAVASAVLTISQRIGVVGETIIKGLANIFGSPFAKKCKFLNGLTQIFIKLPLNVIGLLFTPMEVAFGAIITTGSFLVSPEGYSSSRSEVHRSVLKNLGKCTDDDILSTYSILQLAAFA